MSGGFTPSLRRNDVAVSGKASFLASENMTVKRAGITMDASVVATDSDGNKIVEAGTLVTPITANGKYGPYDSGATDGREAADPNVSGYLLEAINLKDGDVITGCLIEGSVLKERVTPAFASTPSDAMTGRIIFQ